jgi:hypothetical protein
MALNYNIQKDDIRKQFPCLLSLNKITKILYKSLSRLSKNFSQKDLQKKKLHQKSLQITYSQ